MKTVCRLTISVANVVKWDLSSGILVSERKATESHGSDIFCFDFSIYYILIV